MPAVGIRDDVGCLVVVVVVGVVVVVVGVVVVVVVVVVVIGCSQFCPVNCWAQ